MSQQKPSPEQLAQSAGAAAAAAGSSSDSNPYVPTHDRRLWLAWRSGYDAKVKADKLCQ